MAHHSQHLIAWMTLIVEAVLQEIKAGEAGLDSDRKPEPDDAFNILPRKPGKHRATHPE